MELLHVIGVLNRIVGDKLLRDGMECSEPILSIKNEILVDNFFVYYVNLEGNIASGPVARVGIMADRSEIDYLVLCDDQPFSIAPHQTMKINNRNITEQVFEDYEKCYKKIRSIAYKSNCTDIEKNDIQNYLRLFERIIPPELLKLYEEFVPEFFEWIRKETGDL